MTIEPKPEKTPLIKTICNGSLEEIFRVQLFSNPQHTHANRINAEPKEKRKLSTPSKDNNKQEQTTNAIPVHSRALIFSLNASSAITAVVA